MKYKVLSIFSFILLFCAAVSPFSIHSVDPEEFIKCPACEYVSCHMVCDWSEEPSSEFSVESSYYLEEPEYVLGEGECIDEEYFRTGVAHVQPGYDFFRGKYTPHHKDAEERQKLVTMNSETRKEYLLKATLLHQLDKEYNQLESTKLQYQQELKDKKRDMKVNILSILVFDAIMISASLFFGVQCATIVTACLVVHTAVVIIKEVYDTYKVSKTIHKSMDAIDQKKQENREEYRRIASL